MANQRDIPLINRRGRFSDRPRLDGLTDSDEYITRAKSECLGEAATGTVPKGMKR